MAIFGDQLTKLFIEQQAARYCQSLRDALIGMSDFQAWLTGVADADLLALSPAFTVSDIAFLRGAFADGTALHMIASGKMPPPAATGINVYRGTAAGAENVLVATLGAVTAWTDTGAVTASLPAMNTATLPAPSGLAVAAVATGGNFPAATYYWTVTGTNAAGETTGSHVAGARIVLDGSATLTWAALPDGTTGVNVYRGTVMVGQKFFVASLGAVTSYTDTGTAVTTVQIPGTNTATIAAPSGLAASAVTGGGTFGAGTYFWVVTGLTAAGETTGSGEVTATVAAGGSAALTWSALPAGTVNVKIYRGTAAGAENVLVAMVGTVVTYTDTGSAGTPALTPPVINTALLPPPSGLAAAPAASGGSFAAGTYYWKITALNALGETTGSLEASAAVAASGTATLTWDVLPAGYPQPATTYPYLADAAAVIGSQ